MSAGVSAWVAEAVCASVGSDPFYPEGHRGTYDAAREICAACRVRAECLDWAMTPDPSGWPGVTMSLGVGMWGGLTPRERARLAASGWRPGDPTPPVTGRVRACCPWCGHRGTNLSRHMRICAARHVAA